MLVRIEALMSRKSVHKGVGIWRKLRAKYSNVYSATPLPLDFNDQSSSQGKRCYSFTVYNTILSFINRWVVKVGRSFGFVPLGLSGPVRPYSYSMPLCTFAQRMGAFITHSKKLTRVLPQVSSHYYLFWYDYLLLSHKSLTKDVTVMDNCFGIGV